LTNNQNELESLREEMTHKNRVENDLRRQIELLTMENNRLKNSTNNTNTINNASSRKKLYSSTRENFNSMSNYNSPNIRSPIKKGRNPNSLLLKTDRKENKKNLDSRLFRSPQNTQLKKTTKKILQSKLEKKNTNLLKKTEKSKTNKTVLGYNSADIRTEPNSNFNSNKGILGKSKQTLNTKKKTTFNLPIKNETQKKSENTKKILNRTVNNFNKMKDQSNTNTINKPDSISIKHDSEDSSSESSSYSKSVNKSRITSIDYEEENTIIDEEISEMNYFEEEITSLMEEIREFKKNNNENNDIKDKDKINEENKTIENKSSEIKNTENKAIDNKSTEIKNTENKSTENKNTENKTIENKTIDNKEIKENKENKENKDNAKNKGGKVSFKVP